MMANMSVSREVAAPPEQVFARAADFANAPRIFESILAVEMLGPEPVGTGTRFRETRRMFGREATEEMEVVAFEPPRRYALAAENHGARYESTLLCEPIAGGTKVTLVFAVQPLTFMARLMGLLTRPMIKAMAKACAKDLDDLAASFEKAA
jgi:hypothetical protein